MSFVSLSYHTIFVIVAVVFFLFRFWCEPKAYRLLLAVWAPCTMMGYLIEDTWWSYLSLGVQAAFLIGFILLKFLDKRRARAEKISQNAQDHTVHEELNRLDTKLP